MANEIFTEDELKAEEQGPGEEQQQGGDQQGQQQDRPRRADGTFMSADEIAAAAAETAKAGEGGEGAGEESKEGKDRTVPQGALHAERERRKAAEGELAKIKEQLDALAKMREQVASRKPADLPAADDPAALEHLRTRLAEMEQATTRISQHIDTQAINSAEIKQIGSVAAQAEAEYRKEHPDYDEAILHVVNARAQELGYYGLTPPQIAQTISEEATDIIRAAIAQNRNPAELAYQIAVTRGYRPKEASEASKPNGEDKSAAQRTLDAIAEAKKQGKSLGGSGTGKAGQLNAEAVLAMSPEEFDRVYSTPEGKAMIDAL